MKKLLNYCLENPIRSLVLIGIIFRAILFFFFYSSYTRTLDSDGYIELSEVLYPLNLLGYNGLRTVGYPIFITLFNQNLYLVILFQFCLGISTTIVWFKTLLNYRFSVKSSFLITVFLMSFISNFFYETCILVETLVLFNISLLLYLISKFTLEKLNLKQVLTLGLLFFFLVLIKPFYAFLPFLMCFFLVVKTPNFKTILSKNLILIILPMMAYLGCCYLNKINIGYFIPTSTSGLTRAQNCVYFAEKTPKEYDWIAIPYAKYRDIAIREETGTALAIWDAISAGSYDKYNLTFEQLSYELGKYANATILQNPKEYMIQVITISWFDFWRTTALWNEKKFKSETTFKTIDNFWDFQHLILRFFKVIFLFLTPYYLVLFIKTRKVTNEFIICIIVLATSILQALAIYGTNSRFSFPFEFCMIILVFMFLKEKINYSKYRSISLK